MSEILDVYDIYKNRTGKTVERKKDATLNKGEYIIAVQCWIINDKNEILLTQRKNNKHHGGMWEPTTGLIISGETSIQGMKRELFEEIGLNINDNEIHLIKEMIEERKNVNFLRDIYLVRKNIDINDIHFNDGEVIKAKYVTIKEFSDMIKDGKLFEWLNYFIKLYDELI